MVRKNGITYSFAMFGADLGGGLQGFARQLGASANP